MSTHVNVNAALFHVRLVPKAEPLKVAATGFIQATAIPTTKHTASKKNHQWSERIWSLESTPSV